VRLRLKYRTVFLSDLHLGSRGCRAEEVASFLKHVECETLYLVGDVIDMWRLRQKWRWPQAHNEVVRRILKMVKEGTRVVFIPGNHDEHARQYAGLRFGGVEVRNESEHWTADGRKLLITHGDQFDLVVKHARLVSMLGSWAYDTLIAINHYYNVGRRLLGMRYWSLSKAIKGRVKSACTFIAKFEQTLMDEARRRGFDGVVCGHIHKAEIRTSEIAYFNCGDWVESCTALVEHEDGAIRLVDGLAFLESIREGATPAGALNGADAAERGLVPSAS